MDTEAITQRSHFQWNRGGWFGGQIGATLWLVCLGVLLLLQGVAAGAVPLVLGLAANAFGLLLWTRRERLAAYPALQMMIAAAGFAALVSMAVVARAHAEATTRDMWVLLVYPGLMLVFWLRERSSSTGHP